jgi:Flp pilus assembly protein TadB
MYLEKTVKHFGISSLVVIAVTFILFVVALFVKGFTHDLLLEIAIFLVSIKLILMTYSNSVASKRLERKLDDMDRKMEMLLDEKSKHLDV